MITNRLILIATTLMVISSPSILDASMARYSVTFTGTWSSQNHPGAYPNGAHFSPLVGGVHNDRIQFWTPGGLASSSIEQMAEVGGTSIWGDEVRAAITAGTALSVVLGSGISSPGSTTTTFEVTSEYPLITLTSMVAPTPDWFVGVHDLDLRDGNSWRDQFIVDLYGYDAGTEEGNGFSLSNPDTNPRQPIALLETPFSIGSPPLARFTFNRVPDVPEPSMAASALAAMLALIRRRQRGHRCLVHVQNAN